MKKLIVAPLLFLSSLIIAQSSYIGKSDSIKSTPDQSLSVIYYKGKTGVWNNNDKNFVVELGKQTCFAFQSSNIIGVHKPKEQKFELIGYSEPGKINQREFTDNEKLELNFVINPDKEFIGLELPLEKCIFDTNLNQINEDNILRLGKISIEKKADFTLFTDFHQPFGYNEILPSIEYPGEDSIDFTGDIVQKYNEIKAISNSTLINQKTNKFILTKAHSTFLYNQLLLLSVHIENKPFYKVFSINKNKIETHKNIYKNDLSVLLYSGEFDEIQPIDSVNAITIKNNKKGVVHFELFNEFYPYNFIHFNEIQKPKYNFIYYSTISNLLITKKNNLFEIDYVEWFNEYSLKNLNIQFNKQLQLHTFLLENYLLETYWELDDSALTVDDIEVLPDNYTLEIIIDDDLFLVNDYKKERFELIEVFDFEFGEPIYDDNGNQIFDSILEPTQFYSNIYNLKSNKKTFNPDVYIINQFTTSRYLVQSPILNQNKTIKEFKNSVLDNQFNEVLEFELSDLTDKNKLEQIFGTPKGGVNIHYHNYMNDLSLDEFKTISVQKNGKMQYYEIVEENKDQQLLNIQPITKSFDFIYKNFTYDYTFAINNDSILFFNSNNDVFVKEKYDANKIIEIFPYMDYNYPLGINVLTRSNGDSSTYSSANDLKFNRTNFNKNLKGTISFFKDYIIIDQKELNFNYEIYDDYDYSLDSYYTLQIEWDGSSSVLYQHKDSIWDLKLKDIASIQKSDFGFIFATPKYFKELIYLDDSYKNEEKYINIKRKWSFTDNDLILIEFKNAKIFESIEKVAHGFIVGYMYEGLSKYLFFERYKDSYTESDFDEIKYENGHVFGIIKEKNEGLPVINNKTGEVIYEQKYKEVDLGIATIKSNTKFFVDNKSNTYGEPKYDGFKIENNHVIGVINEIIEIDEFGNPIYNEETWEIVILQKYQEVDLGPLK